MYCVLWINLRPITHIVENIIIFFSQITQHVFHIGYTDILIF